MAECRRQQGGDAIDSLGWGGTSDAYAGTAKLALTFVADDHQVVQRLKIGTGEQVLLVKRDWGSRQLPGQGRGEPERDVPRAIRSRQPAGTAWGLA